MAQGEPIWMTLLQAARELHEQGRSQYSRAHLLDRARGIDPTHTDASYGPVLQGMTQGATGGPPSPVGTPFVRVGRGWYRLEEDSVDAQTNRTGASESIPSRKVSKKSEISIAERLVDLTTNFDHYVDVYDKQVPFQRVGQYELHKATIDLRRSHPNVASALEDYHFIELLYKTLRAWGIGVRASVLLPINDFAAELRSYVEPLARLDGMSCEDIENPDEVTGLVWQMISDINVVKNNAKIVATTKTLHHLLPDLIPPMDRAWTGLFFRWSVVDPQYRQEQIFKQTYSELIRVANVVKPSRLVGSGWHTSSTKLLDNALIGYCKEHRLNESAPAIEVPELNNILASENQQKRRWRLFRR